MKQYKQTSLPEAEASGSFLFLKGFLILLWKNIQNYILYIQVMTDRDLAELYKVETWFQLTEEEHKILRSQFVT